MSLFYLPPQPVVFRRYVGLSFITHVCLILICWSVLKTQIQVLRTTGVDIAIRTMPGLKTPVPPKPRPGASPAAPAVPTLLAPRRKIGRIIEKKFRLDMPKIEPQTAMRRSRTDDEIQLVKDRKIAKLLRSENVELIDVERKDVYKPPETKTPIAEMNLPEGDYVPNTPMPPVEVNIQYVEVAFEAGKINLDDVQWSAPVALNSRSNDGNAQGVASNQPAGEAGKRKAIHVVKPELPPNLGIQEPKIEVILKVVISESGFVSAAEIERSGGYMELDNRALTAIRQWIYESAPKKEVRYVRVEYVF